MHVLTRAIMTLLMPLLAINVMAASIDVNTAWEKAVRTIGRGAAGHVMSPGGVLRLTHVEYSSFRRGVADYYVFNAADGNGFVIVAGDDRAEEILAYGDGTVDMSDLPCNMQWWLDMYREQMEYLHAHPDEQVGHRMVSSTAGTVVEPLLTCRWNQGRPYNDQCPMWNGSRCVTGCVATAMAQVLYYWKFPALLPSLPGYTTSTHRIQIPALPEVQLSWDDLSDSYVESTYSDAEGEAVATLMRYCGQSCQMDYSPGNSGAFVVNELSGMKTFGYNRAGTLLVRYNYTDSSWLEMMLEDLRSGRPILYGGKNNYSVSHAFVIDGFDGSKYHVNWGWGGIGNGFYALDAFGYGYNHDHTMLYHLFPEGVEGLKMTYDFELGGLYYHVTGTSLRVVRGPHDYDGEVVIPDSVAYQGQHYPVTEIEPGAFAGCLALTSVEIGASVNMISEDAFKGCTAMKRVVLPASLTLIRHQAFADCTSLDTVDIPDLKSWCSIRFSDDEACPMRYARFLRVDGEHIVHAVLPAGIPIVNNNLFRGCETLQRVAIPDMCTTIGNYAFYRCKSLNQVEMGAEVAELQYCVFTGCVSLETITLPQSLRYIGRNVFKDCSRLTHIDIPDGVKIMDSYAFSDCKRLARVTIGTGLDTIGSGAFARCTAIDTITCYAVVPPVIKSKSSFHSSIYANAVLRVPRVSLEAYRSAQFWNLFQLIEPIGADADVNGDGEVSISDVNYVIDLLLSGGENGSCDVNGDGEITLADVNLIIDYILR